MGQGDKIRIEWITLLSLSWKSFFQDGLCSFALFTAQSLIIITAWPLHRYSPNLNLTASPA